MSLELGSRRYDVTHRAVIMGAVDHLADQVPIDDWAQARVARLDAAAAMAAAGVDALDVGAACVGSRALGLRGGGRCAPGRDEAVTSADERQRLVPLVQEIRARHGVPVVVHTRRAEVAAACIDAGADAVDNDDGFSDPDLLSVCAAAGASVIVSWPDAGGVQPMPPPGDLTAHRERLGALLQRTVDAGIPSERRMVDPGGAPTHGLRPGDLVALARLLGDAGGHVVLSVDGDEAVATHALAITQGCRVIRTGDVRGARRVAGVLEAVLEHR
jgi:dihydropteroate synthase